MVTLVTQFIIGIGIVNRIFFWLPTAVQLYTYLFKNIILDQLNLSSDYNLYIYCSGTKVDQSNSGHKSNHVENEKKNRYNRYENI